MKCCENCMYWNAAEVIDNTAECLWSQYADLPFWASVNDGDHWNWTKPEEGKRCRTFKPKIVLS